MSTADQQALLDAEWGDLMDLDDLLAESVEKHTAAREAKKSKDRLRRGGLTDQERAEDAARLAAWEAAHVWVAQANVVRFNAQVCERCECVSHHFGGLFTREEHRHLKDSKRWVRTDGINPHLPNETMVATENVPFCSECLDEMGFTWRAPSCYFEDGSYPEDPPEDGPEDGPGTTIDLEADGTQLPLAFDRPEPTLPEELSHAA